MAPGKVNAAVYKFSKALEQIDATRAALSSGTFKREYVNIWTPIPYLRPLPEIMNFSEKKNLLALNYYAESNNTKIVFAVLSFIVLRIRECGRDAIAGTLETFFSPNPKSPSANCEICIFSLRH